MGLTYAEQETIINMHRGGEVAYVYTAEPKILTRLRKNPAATLIEEGRFEGSAWARFEIPAELISFHTLRRKITLTDEQKQERRERLSRVSATRKAQEELEPGPGGAPDSFTHSAGVYPEFAGKSCLAFAVTVAFPAG